jgi:hypothetical protein
MVKKYITGETKQQRKARKALEKAQRSVENVKTLPPESVEIVQSLPPKSVDKKYYVLCLKHGMKYSSDYVNKLYNMVKRNCTLDIEFVCLTEDDAGIYDNITILPLPKGLVGWWCKPYVFSNELPLNGTVLYMDLDVVIAGNIDKLFTYSPGHWCTIRDFTRVQRSNWQRYNSSVVRFDTGSLDFVWEKYVQDPRKIQKQFFGDQDYLYDVTYKQKRAMLYPDSWLLSWKWEVRKSKEFATGGAKGHRRLKTIEDVKPRPECCVCVFHGDPNPANCDDPWVKDNWR